MPFRLLPRRRDGSLLALACALFAASSGALAQPKPALTQNMNEPGLNPYLVSIQPEQDTSNCQPGNPPFASCTFVFPVVPLGKRLVVTYASAAYYLSPGATLAEAFLSATGTGFVQLALRPVQSGIVADRQVVATPVTFYVEPGESPRFLLRGFDILDGRTATLSLAGYYVTLP